MNQVECDSKNSYYPKKKHICVFIGGIALILVIVTIVLLITYTKAPAYLFHSKDLVMEWNLRKSKLYTDNYYTDSNGKVLGSFLDDIPYIEYSMDQSKIIYHDSYITENPSGQVIRHSDLYLFTNQGMQKVAENVMCYRLSLDGTSIAYNVRDPNEMSVAKSPILDGDLYLYDAKSGRTKKVSNNCYGNSMVLSPDGDSVAFVKDYMSETDYKTCISINGGEAQVIDSNTQIFAISDNGEYRYYHDGNNMYVRHKNGKKLLLSEGYSSIAFNYDLSEMLFQKEDETYICIDGSKVHRFDVDLEHHYYYPKQHDENNIANIVLPDNCSTISYSTSIISQWFEPTIYGIHHFANQVYYQDENETFCYMDSNLQRNEIGSCPTIRISKDGKKAIYLHDGNLCYMDLNNYTLIGVQMTHDRKLIHFVANADMTDIYAVNNENQLIYIDDNNTTKVIADHICDSYNVICDQFGDVYFDEESEDSSVNDVLYYSQGGKEKVKILECKNIFINDYKGYVQCQLIDDGDYSSIDFGLLRDGELTTLIR